MCCWALWVLKVSASLIFISGLLDLSCFESLRIFQQAETHHPLKLSTRSEMPGTDLWPLPFLIATQAILKLRLWQPHAPFPFTHPPLSMILWGCLYSGYVYVCALVCTCVFICAMILCIHVWILHCVLIKKPTALPPTYSFNSIVKTATLRKSLHAWVFPHIDLYISITQQKNPVCLVAKCMLQGDSEQKTGMNFEGLFLQRLSKNQRY